MIPNPPGAGGLPVLISEPGRGITDSGRCYQCQASPMYSDTSADEAVETGRRPRVSVIIPAFNASEFIAETLESVFGQTFPEYEVIVVNDGSPDTTEFETVSYTHLTLPTIYSV